MYAVPGGQYLYRVRKCGLPSSMMEGNSRRQFKNLVLRLG